MLIAARFLTVFPGMEFSQYGDGRSMTGTSRKLKVHEKKKKLYNSLLLDFETCCIPKLQGIGYNPSNVDLEDYRPIDPVPRSKASIRPGPIQHGSPLIPFIPKPSPPPGHPKSGGFT